MSELIQAAIFALVLVTTCLASTAFEQSFLMSRDKPKPSLFKRQHPAPAVNHFSH